MFHSPWQDLSRQQTMPAFDPKYDLPACYRMSATPSAQSKMTKFSDETLFYIFYAMPQDVLQDAAAYELYRQTCSKLMSGRDGVGGITRGFRCGSQNHKIPVSDAMVAIHLSRASISFGM